MPHGPRTGALVRRLTALPGRRITVAAGLALMAAVLLTLAGLAAYDRGQLMARVQERNELMARVFADRATRDVEGASLALSTLADLLARGHGSVGAEVQAAMAQTLVNLPYLRGIGIVDAQGRVIASRDEGDLGQSIDLGPLGPLPAPGTDALGPYVASRRLSDLARGASRPASPAGTGFLPLLRSVQAPGGPRAVLVAQLNPGAFANFQQVTLGDARAAAALAAWDGQLLAAAGAVTRPPGSSLAELPPFKAFLPRLEQGAWIGAGLRPGVQIGAFRASASRPLVVLVELGRDAAMAEWLRRCRGLLAAALAAVLFITAMTWVASRNVRARETARRDLDLAQAAAVRRERELSITIKSLQELIFRTDAKGTILFVNARWASVTGTDTGSAAGRGLWELVEPAQREAAHALFAPTADGGARHLQTILVDAVGRPRSFDLAVIPLLDGGRLVGFAGSATDVTELVAAQRQLRSQLDVTRQLMEISPLPSSVTDNERRYLLVNKAWEDFTGRRRDEAIGQPAGLHLSPEQRRRSEDSDHWLLHTGQAERYEDVYPHADGTPRDVVVNKMPLYGADGAPYGILSAIIDVTEFRNAERATREARDAAEEASRAKSEFIANISHELRTPLQSIIGFSELGLVRGRAQEKLAGMFGDIHGAGQRMLGLVNNLLDVAKIESTVGTMNIERSDLRGLVREVARELDPLLAARRLRLVLNLTEQPLRAKVDPLRMQQVVRNVLANAVRFSPEGGRIEIEGAIQDSGELRLSIGDEGPGIPPAELETIFEAFVQSSQTKDGSGGTGLGLAICRKIVAAHGGRIHAENRCGRGSVFHILLPARVTAETQPMPL